MINAPSWQKFLPIFNDLAHVAKLILAVATFFGLSLTALATSLWVFLCGIGGEISPPSALLIFLLASAFFLQSWVMYHFFPQRFISWQKVWKMSFSDFPLCWLNPPFTNIFMAISLSFYTGSLLDLSLKQSWLRSEVILAKTYKIVGEFFGLALPSLFIALLFSVVIPIFLVAKYLDGKMNLKNILLVTLCALGGLTVTVLLISRIDLLSHQSEFLGRLLVGSLPIGWFYELFVGSIAKEKRSR